MGDLRGGGSCKNKLGLSHKAFVKICTTTLNPKVDNSEKNALFHYFAKKPVDKLIAFLHFALVQSESKNGLNEATQNFFKCLTIKARGAAKLVLAKKFFS